MVYSCNSPLVMALFLLLKNTYTEVIIIRITAIPHPITINIGVMDADFDGDLTVGSTVI